MSHAFDARFAPVALSREEILRRLDPVLADARIVFDGEVSRLQSRNGNPHAGQLASVSPPTLEAVFEGSRRWWGVGLACASTRLAEELGRTEAMEVYLSVFPNDEGEQILVYNEASSAFHARRESRELQADLLALLVRLLTALGSEMVVFAEETDPTLPASVAEIEERLTHQASSPEPLGWLALIANTRMSFDQARANAGPWAAKVRLATAGYVVLPFLSA